MPELTAAFPQYRELANLPDNCTVIQVAVYSQHSLRHVRDALRTGRLGGAQTIDHGSWRIKRAAMLRWLDGLAPE